MLKEILKILPVAMLIVVLISSCGEEEEGEEGAISTTEVKQGFHMQGRDCLACHNYDLEPVRHLTIAGTVYKNKNTTDINDLNQICGGNLYLRLIDINNITNVINTKDYKDPDSKGYKGKGNVFLLSRKYPNLQGDFIVQIVDDKNNVLAASTTAHKFNSGYDINNPADSQNRYSCNSCHSINPKGGAPGVIYVNPSALNLCK